MSSCKGVILIGGPSKGTRFRPLSLDVPKPLFPVGGLPMIEHHVAALSKVGGITEVLLLGFYEPSTLEQFVSATQRKYRVRVRYLEEEAENGTASGLLRYKNEIWTDDVDAVFVLHSDICCAFPLVEMLQHHRSHGGLATIAGTKVPVEESQRYGCLVEDPAAHLVVHYSEKPESFVSNIINTGMYIFGRGFVEFLESVSVIKSRPSAVELAALLDLPASHAVRLEQDVLQPLASSRRLHLYVYNGFWAQIKSASQAVKCSQLYMEHGLVPLTKHASGGPTIVGNVTIDAGAEVHPTAKIGPNVSIFAGARVGPGVRVMNSIILEGVELKMHSCVLNSILGWNSTVGAWARVEGSPVYGDDSSTHSAARMTIFGAGVDVDAELIVRNSVVLPYKRISESVKDTIIL